MHDVEWYDKHLTKINLNKIFLWMMFFLKKKEYSDLFWKLKKRKKEKDLVCKKNQICFYEELKKEDLKKKKKIRSILWRVKKKDFIKKNQIYCLWKKNEILKRIRIVLCKVKKKKKMIFGFMKNQICYWKQIKRTFKGRFTFMRQIYYACITLKKKL